MRINHISIDDKLNGFLIGSKLGDGAFIKKSNNHNTYVVFKHSEKQLDYIQWKYDFLKSYGAIKDTNTIEKVNMVGCFPTKNQQYSFRTKSFVEFNQYVEKPYIELIKDMNIISLITWIMDDGGFQNGGICKIAFPNKTIEEKFTVLNTLLKKFELSCYMYEHPTNRAKDYILIRKSSYKYLKQTALDVFGDLETVRSKMQWK